MPTRKIKFSKYHCVFNELIQGYEADQDTNRFGIVNLEEEGFEEQPSFKKGPPIGPAVISEFGILPINEKTLASKNFNLWIMHTNFTVDSVVADCIESCPGIETLDIITRYRCRLGFAEMFVVNDVKDTLTKLLCEEPKPTNNNALAQESVVNFLSKKYVYWALIVTKGNALVPIGSDKQEEVEQRINSEQNIKEVTRSWTTQQTTNL